MTTALEPPDLLSNTHKRNPFPYYARLRAEAPVYQANVPRLGKAWLVTCYDDVVACLKDEKRFIRSSSAGSTRRDTVSALLSPPVDGFGPTMIHLDGPPHKRLRAITNRACPRSAMEALRPRIEIIAHELLDLLTPDHQIDLVADYALALALAVICELLGLPIEVGRKLQSWSQVFLTQRSESGSASRTAFFAYVKEIYQARRAKPQDDALTVLAGIGECDGGLDEFEFVALVHLFLFAGQETTTNLIGSGTLALLENPPALEQFRRNPDGRRMSTEELLRFCAPVEMAVARSARKNTVLHDQELAKGDIVFAVIASANRDATRFVDPDCLDLNRNPNPHLAFGQGVHYCFGSDLAKLEVEIAIGALFDRFPLLRLAVPSASLRWRPTHIVRGLEALPVMLR